MRPGRTCGIWGGAGPRHPDDPVAILPGRFREQFLAEYAAAAEAARQVEGYRTLHDLLRRWRLTAAAYSEPGSAACGRPCAPAARTCRYPSRKSSRTGPPA
jgi:hypothetical protein